MARAFLKVYFDFMERTRELNDNERGRLLLAMLDYARTGDIPELKGNERFCFSTFKVDIDRDCANYASKVNNGSKGGRPAQNGKPKKSENNLNKPNESENNLNAKNKNKKEEKEEEEDKKENIKRKSPDGLARSRFIPPSIEEVKAYCQEHHNGIDAARFVDYYTSNGWRVGKQPMKDWKAAVRNWERRQTDGDIQLNNEQVGSKARHWNITYDINGTQG